MVEMEYVMLLTSFFIDIGPKLASTCKEPGNPMSNMKRNDLSAFFKPCTQKEIVNIVLSLKNGKSPGFDEIDAVPVKRVIHILCVPLCAIFNLSLTVGIVPDSLKIAKVTPIYKSGTKDDMSNYRPISVLPLFSKILERCVFNRVIKFLDKCNIIIDNQFGFRPKYSTSFALVDFLYNVLNALDRKEITIGLFLDLSKAFDSLDHHILLDKLYCYGFRGIVHKWFESYLSNRKQYITNDGCKSDLMTIRCGVPQGSILGPLLFILYVNDICNVSEQLKLILFADDTSVFMSNTDLNVLQQKFTTELNKLVNWLEINRLVLNIKKTNFMIFSNKKNINVDSVSIKIKNIPIQHVSHVKFLGVTIDENLSWNQHIGAICNRLSKNIGILYKLHSYPKIILLLLFNTLILPHLNYCIYIWGNCSDQNMSRLLKLQKKAIRIISHAGYRAHTEPIFSCLNLLNIHKMYLYQCGIFMYSNFHQLLPVSLPNYFKLNNQVHAHETRNRTDYHLPLVRLSSFKKSIFYSGPKFWNDLPAFIKMSPSLNIFKARLKRHLLQL